MGFEGQTCRLCTYDGVNFIKDGAEKLGRYFERDLRRLLGSHVLPATVQLYLSTSVEKGGPLWAPQAIQLREPGPARFTRPQSQRSYGCTARACRRCLFAAA